MKVYSINQIQRQKQHNNPILLKENALPYNNQAFKNIISLNNIDSRIFFGAGIAIINKPFKKEAMTVDNPKWENAICREQTFTQKPDDFRTDFELDYDRIVYSDAFDRLRWKTQVIFDPQNDMISTRSSHVTQVTTVARRIAKRLGLNDELAEAIAIGHDLGHSPFGHEGERALKKICKENGLDPFWHEKNSLKFVDKLITKLDSDGKRTNLNLSYAVRDGLICHCGEVDENGLKPRQEFIDLYSINTPGKVAPYTWEGCVMKLSDKIAYIGRDIEDAYRLGILEEKDRIALKQLAQQYLPEFDKDINNSVLINLFATDLCNNSTPQEGLKFSKPVLEFMNAIKQYNYKHIYLSPKKERASAYAATVLTKIFETYDNFYDGDNTIKKLNEEGKELQGERFGLWLERYTKKDNRQLKYKNDTVYDLSDRQQYRQAIVDYIAGMTDRYAVKTYEKIINPFLQ